MTNKPEKPKVLPPPKPDAPEAPPTNIIPIDDLVTKDRQARTSRAAKAIDEVCKAERVALVIVSFDFADGRLFPKLALRPTEPVAA